jgi:hypothetical protein
MSVENKFEIIIIYNGASIPLEVNANQSLQAVFEHALKLVHLQNAPGDLRLLDMNNNVLDLSQSVASAGISAGTRIQLRAPAGGG